MGLGGLICFLISIISTVGSTYLVSTLSLADDLEALASNDVPGGRAVPPNLDASTDVEPVCLAFVGDLMHHCTQATGAQIAAGGSGYDYSQTFRVVKPILEAAAIVVGNLETPVDGRQEDHCYPRFSAPVEYLDAMAEAGFDVLSLANNHALDRGSAGLARTIARIHKRSLLPVGADSLPAVQSVEVEGLSFAFLAATEIVNFDCRGEPCPVKFNHRDGSDVLAGQVEAAARDHDVVVVLLHWMNEYRHRPRSREVRLAEALAEAGATVVVGSHSHVLGPWKFTTVDGDGRRTYVRFSLGNFVHAMKKFPAKLGGIERVCFAPANSGGVAAISSVEFIPTYVRRSAGKLLSRVFQPVLLDVAHSQCESAQGPYPELTKKECREICGLKELLDEHPDWRGPGHSP